MFCVMTLHNFPLFVAPNVLAGGSTKWSDIQSARLLFFEYSPFTRLGLRAYRLIRRLPIRPWDKMVFISLLLIHWLMLEIQIGTIILPLFIVLYHYVVYYLYNKCAD